MQINKKQSPIWVRVTVWILVAGLIAGVGIITAIQIIGNWNNLGTTTTDTTQVSGEEAQSQINTIDAQYQSEAEALGDAADAAPDDKDAQVAAATAFNDWGNALLAIQESNAQQVGIIRIGQSKPYWERAWKLDGTDTEVGGDYANSLYYSGDTTSAIQVARDVLNVNDKLGLVWYNLGNYLAYTQPQAAIGAFEEAIKNDDGSGYADYAQQMIDSLKESTTIDTGTSNTTE
ncbi:MAG: hypothetical protein LBS17_06885 [Actinomycetes bacterium]|jgi:Flp pilus assembly protein TadD|nr:hypothetical protein [Actinomycetes bacterium]